MKTGRGIRLSPGCPPGAVDGFLILLSSSGSDLIDDGGRRLVRVVVRAAVEDGNGQHRQNRHRDQTGKDRTRSL